ncbi:MAG: DNA mismatch repair endonuclease MutL [Clostridia bacterium]|nr:DNA mismatch repair endonuclease MutL [Clostridia bacterium]
MGKINVLSFEIANLIAAGEVVDRPASVLKELLENSIDAGAKKIRAEIKDGGVTMIKVTDDGHGMDGAELPIAIKRHATSKISDKSDLDSIMTLGFRGEALAATAAVSKLTIISKTESADSGTALFSEGGRVTEVTEVGCSDGTTMIVEDLFYNVPARRSFLKKDKTEALACYNVVSKLAMSRPDVSVEFFSDGVLKFSTVGDGRLLNTLYSLEGQDFAKKLIEVKGEDAGIRVTGYVGRSDNVRNNRNYVNTFINKRYVKSNTVAAALEQAFSSYIAPGKFPVSILFVDIDSRLVDVNVHPAKLEVKFSNESAVFSAVFYAVKNALESFSYRHEMRMTEPKAQVKEPVRSFIPIEEKRQSVASRQFSLDTAMRATAEGKHSAAASRQSVQETVTPEKSLEILEEIRRAEQRNTPTSYVHSPAWDAVSNAEKRSDDPKTDAPDMKGAAPSVPDQGDRVIPRAGDTPYVSEEALRSRIFEDENRKYRYVGEIFNGYLLLEGDDRVLMIDKHAAHERINFEAMKDTLKNDRRVASQGLLFPLEVHLGGVGVSVAEENREKLEALGFSFTVDGRGRLKLTAYPHNIDSFDATGVFSSIVDRMAEGTGDAEISEEQRMEKSLYQIACKASIKIGKRSDASHICWLIEKLLGMPDITVCPHGRPVAIELKKSEIEREFNRIN